MMRLLTPHVARRLAILYALLLVGVSSLPGFKLPDLSEGHLDKVLHGLEYAILGFLVVRGWGPFRERTIGRWHEWVPYLILIVFAAIDEYHQTWIPGRFSEWFDWMADALGITIGYLYGMALNLRTVRSRRPPLANPAADRLQS